MGVLNGSVISRLSAEIESSTALHLVGLSSSFSSLVYKMGKIIIHLT